MGSWFEERFLVLYNTTSIDLNCLNISTPKSISSSYTQIAYTMLKIFDNEFHLEEPNPFKTLIKMLNYICLIPNNFLTLYACENLNEIYYLPANI